MAKHESKIKRARPVILQSRVSEDDAALVRGQARTAGVSVSALIRHALLAQAPLRGSRKPAIEHELTARLLVRLGQCATALRQAAETDNAEIHGALIKAAHRDLAEMRTVLFQALGREP